MLLKKKHHVLAHNASMRRCGSIKHVGATLAPLMEGPSSEEHRSYSKRQNSIKHWVKDQLEKSALPLLCYRRSDIRLLLGVLGASLGPFPVGKLPPTLSPKDLPIEVSSAQYLVQQYIAATGGIKLQNSVQNMYAMGKVAMAVTELDSNTRNLNPHLPLKAEEEGCFVLWQMKPDKWHLELALADSKMQAGSDGMVVWRHTPWSGFLASKGPIRPLRRILQGLDPRTTANMFANGLYVGEKRVGAEECFILKLAADSFTLAARNSGPIDIIRHVVLGYFSQKTGLLVRIEDSNLIRIQATGDEASYLETTIEITLEKYQPVNGLMIAHMGSSVVRMFKFGESAKHQAKVRIQETWTIEEFAYNVPGLSSESFIPPTDVQSSNAYNTDKSVLEEKAYMSPFRTHRSLGYESFFESLDDITWRVEI